MTAKTKMMESPLKDASVLYQTKKSERGSILDVPAKGTLELYPAGYVHFSERDQTRRQDLHQAIWERAISVGSNDGDLYPFNRKTHRIELVPDPSNAYDEHAVHVILRTRSDGVLDGLDGRDLGFIPKKISKYIAQNILMFNGGQILKVRANFHKKYYTTKIILGYGNTTFTNMSRTSINRFKSILEQQ